jgi:hypothetical protein
MKVWLLKTSREDCYILIKVPGKEEYIEANIQVLKELWRKRGNKKMNLKFLISLSHLPRNCYRFNYFPNVYNRVLVYSRSIIYVHEIRKIGKSYWWRDWTKLW